MQLRPLRRLVKLTITRRLGIKCIESEELQEVQLVRSITVTSQEGLALSALNPRSYRSCSS